jgi:hypothetical protein
MRDAVEKKVGLPGRWLKGFGEVQVAQQGMIKQLTLPPIVARNLLRKLPLAKTRTGMWLTMTGQQPRFSTLASAGAIALTGIERLRVLEGLLKSATSLDIYGFDPTTASSRATAWVLNFTGSRFLLVLSESPSRGFSGEGKSLAALATLTRQQGKAMANENAVAVALAVHDVVSVAAMADFTGLSRAECLTRLTQIASQGLSGYDLIEDAFFSRVLPFVVERVDRLNPRVKAAKELIDKVTVLTSEPGKTLVRVQNSGVTYRVTLDGEQARCTCPWHAKNGSDQGPCKHILAVFMYRADGNTNDLC